MHVRDLVELAGLATAHGPVLIRCDEMIPSEAIEQYWTSSKVRLDRWTRSLKAFAKQFERGQDSQGKAVSWLETRGVFEEILASEILTRVWTAVLCSHDRRHGTNLAEPVARSVLIGHIEARHRALTLMVRARGIEPSEGKELNHLRRHAERWSDMLIGRFDGQYGVNEFAIEPSRAEDFAQDSSVWRESPQNRIVWPLALVSLRASFQNLLTAPSPNADQNARIAGAVLACFPPKLYHATGLFRSLWMLRLSTATEDVQGMIDDLLAPATDDFLSQTTRHPHNRIR